MKYANERPKEQQTLSKGYSNDVILVELKVIYFQNIDCFLNCSNHLSKTLSSRQHGNKNITQLLIKCQQGCNFLTQLTLLL